MRDFFWELPLNSLSTEEWETLCDGCGKCCLIKLEDEDTNEIIYTRLACKLFDSKSCGCSNYHNRMKEVPDCLKLTIETIPNSRHWLPQSCAYVLRYDNKPLPSWHPLLNGGKDVMHANGHSAKDRTYSEEVISEIEEAISYIDQDLGPK